MLRDPYIVAEAQILPGHDLIKTLLDDIRSGSGTTSIPMDVLRTACGLDLDPLVRRTLIAMQVCDSVSAVMTRFIFADLGVSNLTETTVWLRSWRFAVLPTWRDGHIIVNANAGDLHRMYARNMNTLLDMLRRE